MADADKDDGDADRKPPYPKTAATTVAPRTGGSPQPGDIQTYIGARLRQVFDDVAKQPVPDRFLQLMAELDRS